MNIVPTDWMPNCSMKRIVLHWTAGAYKASGVDLGHYHILIEDDGRLVKGTHSIKDNVSTGNSNYAAHTKNLNTGSIGVSVCCMAGAVESPFKAGNYPMKQKQWDTMAQVVAELCDFYDIPVAPGTVLGHGEVQGTLGVRQDGKWDPMVLPWDTSLTKKQVGDVFRAKVETLLTGVSTMQEVPASITVIIQGKTFREAQIFNEKSVVKLRPVVEELDWMVLHANEEIVEINFNSSSSPKAIPYKLVDQSNDIVDVPTGKPEAELVSLIDKYGFVSGRDIAAMLSLPIAWDGSTRTVTIG
jgi:N-acetylmuramoyl-L-alanine amidase